ncbi:MAG: DNA-processing protein DprA [Gemmatimonadaceae bacterium]
MTQTSLPPAAPASLDANLSGADLDSPAAMGDALEAGLALALVSGVGSVRYGELMALHGSAAAALARLPRAAAADAREQARRQLDRTAAIGGRVLLRGRPDYPAALLDLPDPPPVLFALGSAGWLARPQVAIVGTRSATSYGLSVARELARAAAAGGLVVSSGMARGVDAAAHLGALSAGGGTIAVLGTGVDVAYPRSNSALHRQIAQHGLILSEMPPGDRADAGSFPRRNRVIAALASVTVVVQAGHRSGALITAGRALDLGRLVAAVPGPIDVVAHAGSNELLRDGAQVVTCAADLLQLAGAPPKPTYVPTLAGPEAAVWQALADGPADLDSLLVRTGLPARECAVAVGAIELAGLVAAGYSGELRRMT